MQILYNLISLGWLENFQNSYWHKNSPRKFSIWDQPTIKTVWSENFQCESKLWDPLQLSQHDFRQNSQNPGLCEGERASYLWTSGGDQQNSPICFKNAFSS